MTRRLWLVVLALALLAPAALASAPRGSSTASLSAPELEIASPPSLSLERALATGDDVDSSSGFALFAVDELAPQRDARGASSLTRPLPLAPVGPRGSRFLALDGVQLIDEDLGALAQDLRRADELGYPKTRIGGLRLLGQDLVVVSTPINVEVRWGCGDFGCGISEGIGNFLSEDPEQDLDSPDLYAFVGNRPNEFNDPRGRWLETAVDVVSTGWDAFKAGKEYLTTGRVSSETKTDLLLDAAGLVLPGVTAGVLKAGAKALRMADRGIDAARAASRAANIGDEASHVFKGADRAADGARGAGRAVRAADDIADARKVVNGADDLGDARRVASGADHEADAGRVGRRAEGAGKGARRAEDASGARRLDDGIGCPFRSFSPETLVATASGLIPIDQVVPGTEVWAFDEETGERSLRKLSSTAFHLAEGGLLLTVGGETLRTTAEHPFFTAGGEWVEAAKLQVGQEVRSLGGELLRVEKLERRDGRFAVFNFEVDQDHSYFVGDAALLVHNGGPCARARPPAHGPGVYSRETASMSRGVWFSYWSRQSPDRLAQRT